MSLKFINTQSRRKEEFTSIEPGHVRMYNCGPTIYDFAHIGNYRAYMFEDLLRRYLQYRRYRVTQVMNLTDIDDKIIRGLQEKGLTLKEYTNPFKQAFFEDLDALEIQRAEHYPEATDHIDEMVAIVQTLIEKGHAYEVDGSYYFKISSFPKYGSLSHMNLEDLKAGARVSADEYEKDTVSDFALWKAWEEADGPVFWETPIGKGRPGWHIECSAMSMKYLGETFDIHTGGVDNMFPHHENEIAQSECATGKTFANYWLHCEHLIVEGQKMSKSLGNFYTLRDITAKGYSPVAVRYLLLATHYRQQLNFTFDGLDGAKAAVERLIDFKRNLQAVDGADDSPDFAETLKKANDGFQANLDDDLNMSGATMTVSESSDHAFRGWRASIVCLVIYESMASGLPVVITENCGVEIRDGVDGFRVPIRDVQALKEKIVLLYEDNGLREQMSINARQWVEQHSWEKYRERVASILLHIYWKSRG